MPQDCVHHTHCRAPGEALNVHGATEVKIGIGSCLQKQPEARQVVVSCADVQRADHKGCERPGRWVRDPRGQMGIHINISSIPEERRGIHFGRLICGRRWGLLGSHKIQSSSPSCLKIPPAANVKSNATQRRGWDCVHVLHCKEPQLQNSCLEPFTRKAAR